MGNKIVQFILYGAAVQWGTACSKGGPDTATTNSLGGPLLGGTS